MTGSRRSGEIASSRERDLLVEKCWDKERRLSDTIPCYYAAILQSYDGVFEGRVRV